MKGDLRTALLLIFVLLLIGTMLKLQEEFDSKSDIAERYKELQIELYDDLQLEFTNDLGVWKAEIDSTLTFRFKEPDVLFDQGKSDLKESFTLILKDFLLFYNIQDPPTVLKLFFRWILIKTLVLENEVKKF